MAFLVFDFRSIQLRGIERACAQKFTPKVGESYTFLLFVYW